MKLFCAYAFTGEDVTLVTERMQMVVNTLNEHGHNAYCNRFDEKVSVLQAQDDIRGIFHDAFIHLKASDAIVAIISSPNRSVGQIMEIGIALSLGKKVYLFEHESAKGSSYLPRLVDEHILWSDSSALQSELIRLATKI